MSQRPLASAVVSPSHLPHSLPQGRFTQGPRKIQPNFCLHRASQSPGEVEIPGLGMFRKDDVKRGNLNDACKHVNGDNPGEYIYSARMGEVYTFVDPPHGYIPPENRFTIGTGDEYIDDGELIDEGRRRCESPTSPQSEHVLRSSRPDSPVLDVRLLNIRCRNDPSSVALEPDRRCGHQVTQLQAQTRDPCWVYMSVFKSTNTTWVRSLSRHRNFRSGETTV